MKNSILISLLIVSFLFIFTSCSQGQENEVTLDEKIGQMLKVGFRGLSVDENSPIVEDIRKYHIGGVVLFDYDVPRDTALRNISSPGQVQNLVQDLQRFADIPLIIAIDQEGGRVARLKTRYGFEKSVSAQYLGSLQNADSTRKYAHQTGQTLSELGINTNLAPVVDVNINPENPVIGGIERSFSDDPSVVTRHARLYI
ncbi:MAG TPA: glycoside hydrolase family 3 N-terminal domain-containing protein, partial [Halalkalibaculum sp.]|nr:glycoside hydrolase family 3 N-terminal domain-containing protein [Halalkalibaculum sp.]